MAETLTSLASENLNPSLRSLLEDVQHGHIRVPRFQRPFIWTDDQRLELLESVRDNMPIGSLLVWRTAKFELASFDKVGSHRIPLADAAMSIGRQYLLDGHQRVSTLLGLLLPASQSKTVDREDDIDWDIRYDLISETFVFARKATQRKGRPLLPLWTLFDGRQVNKYLRELRVAAIADGWSESDITNWEERADQLSYRFQQFRVPIVIMVTEDLALAARTFQRVNSLGTPMSEAHLVAALTWRPDFDLRERLEEINAQFPETWHSINDDIFLQVCRGLSGLDMTKAGETELVRRLADDPTLLKRAGANIGEVINWLITSAGCVRQELLPYSFQLVLLAVEFENLQRQPDWSRRALSWFWRTSWSESFAAATGRSVRAEQQALRNESGSSDALWNRRPLPERFDFRSARARLFILRLATRKDSLQMTGNPVDAKQLLLNHGREAFPRLFSIPSDADHETRRLIQGIGNRFLIEPARANETRDCLISGSNLLDVALKSQFVTKDAIDKLRGGDLSGFLSERALEMDRWDEGDHADVKSAAWFE
ncbi:DUF262 domain-containing protein [Caballeronia sp. EK]|uniref:DUF262 domain-containing protein n=1 Tax=Caballeronia sp. EK TaxID=2767469 RepID=UPI001655CB5B|nr:DUF262 domain-containing protein [Caballeronia sp. EK]MBC8641970.1 DUF262 domain-containing protein [Caballeronia sp. EK]